MAGKLIKVTIDDDDLKWLEEQAYPYALDAAGYLRMFVRRQRLGMGGDTLSAPLLQRGFDVLRPGAISIASGPNAPLPAMSQVTVGGDGQPLPPGGDPVDLDGFIADEVAAAEQEGLLSPEESEAAADVIAIGPRRQRSAKEWGQRA